jgi:hypothetical protein
MVLINASANRFTTAFIELLCTSGMTVDRTRYVAVGLTRA